MLFFHSSNCKSNTPLTSVIINLKYIIITAAMKVETDTITSITMSPVGWAVILEIIYVETFTTDLIVFIPNVSVCLRSHWLIILSISQFVDTDTHSLGEVKGKMSILLIHVPNILKYFMIFYFLTFVIRYTNVL